ncbi:MAG: DUF5667 domain-containing protein [Patescibacteria group bacterium]
MKRDTEKLLAILKNVVLTADERARIRAHLETAANATSVTFGQPGRLPLWAEIRALSSRRFSFLKNMVMAPIAIALVIALSAGGGVAFAAQGSVPGDVLYPVKIEVNERVAAALAVSTEAKAGLDARLAEERLEEATELSEENRLTVEAKTEIRERVAERLTKTKERVAELKKRGRGRSAAEVEARLRASLERRAAILRDLDVSVSFSDDDSSDDTSNDSPDVRGDGSLEDDSLLEVDIDGSLQIGNGSGDSDDSARLRGEGRIRIDF